MTGTAAIAPPPPLQHFLELAYQHGVGVGKVTADPAIACAAAGYSRAELEAKVADLEKVNGRCVVSTVRAAFLRRVLAMLPPTAA